jgi:hypothetical protein
MIRVRANADQFIQCGIIGSSLCLWCTSHGCGFGPGDTCRGLLVKYSHRELIVAGVPARHKQSSHPARRRSSHLSATPIFSTVAVANIRRANGVPYAPQISNAVSDQPGAYSATPEKKPEKGHCIAHANWLCRQPGVGSMRMPREVVDGLTTPWLRPGPASRPCGSTP